MIGGDEGSYAVAPLDQMTFALGGVPGEGFLSKRTTITPQADVPVAGADPNATQGRILTGFDDVTT